MDEYIAFMKKYNSSSDTVSMMADYTKIMKKYTEFAEKVQKYDSTTMSKADAAYYLEVTSRVSKKLLEVAQ